VPVLAGACEVDRKSALEVGRAVDLPRDEDGVVDRAQILHRNLEHVEIAGQTVGGQSRVVQDAAPVPLALDRDQRREAVLRDELAAVAEVVLGVP